MRYSPFDQQLFINNRKRLQALLPTNAVAIVASNDSMPTNADGTMGFKQNSDLFYLCGIDQENTVLVLAPNHPDPSLREVLFIDQTSELIAIWEGYKYTKPHANETSGIKTIYWTHQFEVVIRQIVFASESLFLNSNEHLRNGSHVETRQDRLNNQLKKDFPLHSFNRLAPKLHQLRMIKQGQELEALQTAIDITASGFDRLLKFVKPGVMEYEIEAELIHEFVKNKSKGFAYTPIIASGASACVLHYIENNKACNDGELILLDVAAEYANYNADMTRVLPVNGRFTARQKQVYQAVLDTTKFAEGLMKPGMIWDQLQKEVERFIEGKCIDLGLFSSKDVENQNPEAPLFKKYFMHGNSHHLGLDVHDVWDKFKPFAPGMVLTNEPGIYIQEERIGVRLENNILITSGNAVNLMAKIPIEIEEIEDAMNR